MAAALKGLILDLKGAGCLPRLLTVCLSVSLKLKIYLSYSMCIGVCLYVYTCMCLPGAYRGQKGKSDPIELDYG